MFARDKCTIAQACFLPCSIDNTPLIGRLHSTLNIFVATGHSCWGIRDSLATGEAIAALVQGRKYAHDLTPFDPMRFQKQK